MSRVVVPSIVVLPFIVGSVGEVNRRIHSLPIQSVVRLDGSLQGIGGSEAHTGALRCSHCGTSEEQKACLYGHACKVYYR